MCALFNFCITNFHCQSTTWTW